MTGGRLILPIPEAEKTCPNLRNKRRLGLSLDCGLGIKKKSLSKAASFS